MTNYYKHKGFSKPGVTSIIGDTHDKSPALTQWSANSCADWIRQNCEKHWPWELESSDGYVVYEDELKSATKNFRNVSNKALDIGSQTHAAVEHWLKTGKEPRSTLPEVTNAFLAFLEFFDAHKMKPIELEFSVYGDYWGGTLDYYGFFDGKLYVIDFKTSKNHYPLEHGPQVAAYKSAIPSTLWPSFSGTRKELFEEHIGNGVLRLDKLTGFPDFKDYSKRYIKDLEHFNLMVPLYLHRHPIIAKKAGYNPPF
jgi:hypothetical protein